MVIICFFISFVFLRHKSRQQYNGIWCVYATLIGLKETFLHTTCIIPIFTLTLDFKVLLDEEFRQEHAVGFIGDARDDGGSSKLTVLYFFVLTL
jgi:hypothetical protein